MKSNIHKTERVNLMASKILCGNCLKNLKQRIKQDFVNRIKVKLYNQGMKKELHKKMEKRMFSGLKEKKYNRPSIELGVDMWNFVCLKCCISVVIH